MTMAKWRDIATVDMEMANICLYLTVEEVCQHLCLIFLTLFDSKEHWLPTTTSTDFNSKSKNIADRMTVKDLRSYLRKYKFDASKKNNLEGKGA